MIGRKMQWFYFLRNMNYSINTYIHICISRITVLYTCSNVFFWKKINALKTYDFLCCGLMHCLAERMHRLSRISKTIKNCVRMSVV